MITSAIMIVASLALLLYWFRYTCRLILSAKTAHDYTQQVAAVNELRFLEVQDALLNARERSHLDSLEKKLEDDYHLLSFLVRHSPALQAAPDRLEQRMLMLHFKLMKAYCGLACHISQSTRRWALQEMTQVVRYFANTMGERAACSVTAQ